MSATLRIPSTSSAIVGHAEARLHTPPLAQGPPGPCGCGCALSSETSKGFSAITFAENVLGISLLPWQRWLLIHALETNADGTFRFCTVVVLVARQNGKTFLLKVLSLWRMYVDGARLILGTAQTLQMARESWAGACEMAMDNAWLRAETERRFTGVGVEQLLLKNGSRYKITAANRKAGRGLSVDLLILDELREHKSWEPWSALSKTTMARKFGQIFAISNAGDDNSVVLNQLQDQGRMQIADGSHTNTDLGLFEYSAPDGCELDDVGGHAYANPALGHENGIHHRSIQGSMLTDPPAVFRTEILCQRVSSMDEAIDMNAWSDCRDEQSSMNSIALDDRSTRISACFDVSTTNRHVTLVVAAPTGSGRTRVEVVRRWEGQNCRELARRDLPDLLAMIRPGVLAYFPNGPAAALLADLRVISSTPLHEIKAAEVTAVCMGFSEQVTARRIVHNGDALLFSHGKAAEKMYTGDGWRFARRRDINATDVDAIYAAAGAVHVSRTHRSVGRPRIVAGVRPESFGSV